MDFSKVTPKIAFIFENINQDINVLYHLQTLFNLIKDLDFGLWLDN